jgi:integrase
MMAAPAPRAPALPSDENNPLITHLLAHLPAALMKVSIVLSRIACCACEGEATLPRILSEEEVKRLIEAPDVGTAIGLRDRALMEVLYATGIRHRECWKLNLYDVEVRARRLMVRAGKGGQNRIVPLTTNAAYWVERYPGQARGELAAGYVKGQLPPPPSQALVG